MVIALIGILTAISIVALTNVSNDAAFDKTYQKMKSIQAALIGDPDTNKRGIREYFGYLGDVGSLPDNFQGLQALLALPGGVSSYAVDSTSKIGIGWRGPYLPATPGVDWTKDAWGNSLVYTNNGNNTATLTSYGADGVAGGTGSNQDIVISITSDLTTSTVTGVVNTNAVIYNSTATVNLYAPDGNGNLSTSTVNLTAANNGEFSFSNVPFGLRSIQIYMPNSTSPANVIGPLFVSVDKSQVMVPHNYLDSSPGQLPLICSGFTAATYVGQSLVSTDTTDKIYFDLNITNSMTLNDIYVWLPTEMQMTGIRIGDDIKTCSSGLTCGNGTYNDTLNYPEIPLTSTWTIGAGTKIGAYLQFNSAVSGVGTPIQLRLGCDLMNIQ